MRSTSLLDYSRYYWLTHYLMHKLSSDLDAAVRFQIILHWMIKRRNPLDTLHSVIIWFHEVLTPIPSTSSGKAKNASLSFLVVLFQCTVCEWVEWTGLKYSMTEYTTFFKYPVSPILHNVKQYALYAIISQYCITTHTFTIIYTSNDDA